MDFLAFTRQQKATCVAWYIETQSVTTVRRRYQTTYGETPPVRNTILRWVHNFNFEGNVENRTGRGRPSVTNHSINLVRSYFRRNPRRSIRQAERDLSIPYSTIRKILKTLIHAFPYKIRRVHQLRDNDRASRVQFARWCKMKMSRNENFLSSIVFSDECVFHLSGIANTQNTRIWGTENPRAIQEHEVHSEKITVWCAIHSEGVLDPYYFNNETVRKEDYCQLLDTYVRDEAPNFPTNALFQQDGASPHTSHEARELLGDIFGENWIGKYGPQNWPARSPDLTPPDFFLWGYVKDRVFRSSVNNLTQLKRRITRAVRSVTPEMIKKVWNNLENRLDAIIREGGGHIEYL